MHTVFSGLPRSRNLPALDEVNSPKSLWRTLRINELFKQVVALSASQKSCHFDHAVTSYQDKGCNSCHLSLKNGPNADLIRVQNLQDSFPDVCRRVAEEKYDAAYTGFVRVAFPITLIKKFMSSPWPEVS